MDAEIVAVGHELLMGEIVDTNTSYLAQRLREAGLRVRRTSTVGDNLEELTETFRIGLDRSDLLITTGGLGPTSDDLTREAIAAVFGEEMTLDPDLLDWLKDVFRRRGIDMPSTNLKQAMLTPSARTVPNPMGTAPGWWVERDGRHAILLPGPPRELQRMWQETVGPELAKISGAGVVATRTLKTAGMTEGGIDELIGPLFGGENPYLGIYARPDGIHLRMIARGLDAHAAQALVEPMESKIRSILGETVWGVDDETPGDRVGTLLRERGLTFAAMEGASSGALASQIVTVPNYHEFFKGALVTGWRPGDDGTATEVAADSETALLLADAARQQFGTRLGVGISPIRYKDPSGRDGTYAVGIVGDGGRHATSGRASYALEVTTQRAATLALVELAAAVTDRWV